MIFFVHSASLVMGYYTYMQIRAWFSCCSWTLILQLVPSIPITVFCRYQTAGHICDLPDRRQIKGLRLVVRFKRSVGYKACFSEFEVVEKYLVKGNFFTRDQEKSLSPFFQNFTEKSIHWLM